ncbi:MAG: DNA adenine methylase [Thiotrichales bacterium]|nr:MAG: DNA adenine methylase [Thiotrichales bacterium]
MQLVSKTRPIVKWLGGKYRLIDKITDLLPAGDRLIEPFVGSAAVFLNTNYASYVLNDANPDLINLYLQLQDGRGKFIKYCASYFSGKLNNKEQYYKLRERFNSLECNAEKAALFLYLNRHGFNGLCRYNTGKGEFNVPFGSYVQPYFPEQPMLDFLQKLAAVKVKFVCKDYKQVLRNLKSGDVVYADPPYVPLSKTASFTKYCPVDFTMADQEYLAKRALALRDRNIAVLISNHSNEITKKLYKTANKIQHFAVGRSISSDIANRQRAKELLALF